MKNYFLYLSILLLFKLNLFAAFQEINLGARPLGLGSAFVAVADDANTFVYNPAGIGIVQQKEISTSYSKPYFGLEGVDIGFFQLAALANISDLGKIGLNIYQFNAAGLYTEYSYGVGMADKVFSIEPDWTVYFGAILKLLGHTYNWDEYAKSVKETYGDTVISAGNTKSNISIDAGILIKKQLVSVGLSAQNINQPDIGLKYKDAVPILVRFGFAYDISKIDLLCAAGITYRGQSWGNTLTWNFGLEKSLKKVIVVRNGLTNEGISFGFGVNALVRNATIKFDFAYLHSLIELPAPSLQTSFAVKF
ncbi:MAG: type IX secretion system membrane protein PorP/SprF [Elusimicrobiota bacterium]|nr:type IX secretion system membrane protein PorP/SprF [Elusimicrobiota bacterium]